MRSLLFCKRCFIYIVAYKLRLQIFISTELPQVYLVYSYHDAIAFDGKQNPFINVNCESFV